MGSRVVAGVLFLASGLGRAGEPAQGLVGPRAVSLTVSGGVSLGAYEAGFLAYSIQAVQRDQAADLRLVTGASAGSLNALLALLAACGPDARTIPSASLFWETWIPMGFDQLLATPPTRLGAFSRKWLEQGAARIEEAWSRGIDPACDVVLGVSTTRVEPRLLQAAGGRLELPRMEEKFAIRVQGRGPGRPPRATNYPVSAGPAQQPTLVTDAQGEVAFSAIRDLILASMSFPVAFPPFPLRTCVAGETAEPGVCLETEAQAADYIDGGVFDNAPLRMAVGLARAGLYQPDGPSRGLAWREVPDPRAQALPGRVTFGFVDPSATEYPSTPPAEGRTEPSLARELQSILASLVDTARSKELATLLEEHPEVADRIVMPRRQFPAASAPLFAFLGFFETEFRVFDFHLGMYDARRMLSAGVRTPAGDALHGATSADAAFDAGPGWERFACMRAVYDGAATAAELCQGDALADFRVLLQVSLDQLYDACSTRGPSPRGRWNNPHCERAAEGGEPPRVPGVVPHDRPAWKQGKGESELAYSLRLLGAYGFRFADLGVPPGRGDLAEARIRSVLGRVASELAAAQPVLERPAVSFAGKLLADAVTYAPPDHTFHLTMGPTETELGFSRGFFGSPRIPPGVRIALAAGFRGLEGAFTSGDSAPFGVLLTGGLELQPRGETILGQLRLGLRGGWLFSARDQLGAGSCDAGGTGSVSACTRPVVQGVVGFSVVERFRVQLVGEWFPGNGSRPTAWSFAPGIGLEVGF